MESNRRFIISFALLRLEGRMDQVLSLASFRIGRIAMPSVSPLPGDIESTLEGVFIPRLYRDRCQSEVDERPGGPPIELHDHLARLGVHLQ